MSQSKESATAFAKDTGHKIKAGAAVWTAGHWKDDPQASWRNPGFAQDDSHPAVCVNWDDGKAYVAWLSRQTERDYRLPTEGEREYCCRTGSTTPFWWGSSITTAQANYDGNYLYEGGGSKGEPSARSRMGGRKCLERLCVNRTGNSSAASAARGTKA